MPSSAYDWLKSAAIAFEKRTPNYQREFEKWQADVKRRTTGAKLHRMTGDEFGVLLEDMEWRWKPLVRLKGRLANPRAWPRVRAALITLADDEIPLVERLNQIKPPDGGLPVPHLSQAVITGFLHLRSPHQYCVWNGTTKTGMDLLGLWPKFPRGATFADKYLLINSIISRCSRQSNISVPLLDALWYRAILDLQDRPFAIQEDPAGLEGDGYQLHLRTMRSAHIVRRAKVLWSNGGLVSPSCVVCGWTMADIYGDAAFGFIEAHHKNPMAAQKGQRLTRIKDLAPVCPNCHAILHLSGMTVRELQGQVAARGMASG